MRWNNAVLRQACRTVKKAALMFFYICIGVYNNWLKW